MSLSKYMEKDLRGMIGDLSIEITHEGTVGTIAASSDDIMTMRILRDGISGYQAQRTLEITAVASDFDMLPEAEDDVNISAFGKTLRCVIDELHLGQDQVSVRLRLRINYEQ